MSNAQINNPTAADTDTIGLVIDNEDEWWEGEEVGEDEGAAEIDPPARMEPDGEVAGEDGSGGSGGV